MYDDLKVEPYDEKEVKSKKRIILKRVAITGGAILFIVGVVFALVYTGGGPAPVTFLLGGSGSWAVSVHERI